MAELQLQLSEDDLAVTLGEYTTSAPFAEIMPKETTWRHIYEDAPAYGRELFEKTFRDEHVRSLLSTMPTNERLVLVTNDPRVALIPWEYLRDRDNKLLASRLNFVRGIAEGLRKDGFPFAGALEIVAIPVSPVDEAQVLNTEREWRRLVEAVSITTPTKALTLKRVRPPTLTQMERALNSQATTIIHFMGHSTSHEGKGLLAFEDAHARSHLVDAADFNDALDARVFLVVLNSCLSAIVATTEFGNIAQALVGRGIPYALGMQFVVPDDAALELSRALYDFLLQGRTVEEAVRRTRRALEQDTKFTNAAWLAGIPVLYTNLREPAAAIPLSEGRPNIQPDPERLEKTCDLTALPQAEHFVGRGKEISEALDVLLSHRAPGFVLLHGLGGIGKTATARAIAERTGWHYQDRVLSISFETFASLDSENQLTVNEQFADRFYNRLARFYELDPAQYPAAIDLQQAILQRRTRLRSLLVLDNIETLVDAQKRKHPAAEALASFISRLKEGDGAILLTSRIVPPPDWGECNVVYLSGLSEEAGAELFLALLPADRAHLALATALLALTQRVQGHPLSIRLLAGRFAEETGDLAAFLAHIEAELEIAEQATPASLEDPDRQKTLYACMDYSVKRLTPEQRKVLDAVSIFQAPFLPEFAAYVLDDEEHTPVHLQNLVRLGLLTMEVRTFAEGELVLLELHPMLRWYIQHQLPKLDTALLERYGEVYLQLAQQSYRFEGGYDQSSRMRYLMRQSLPDCEAALLHLAPASRSALAYYLAKPYTRLGQNRHALALYEQALEIDQQLGDVREVAVTQNSMAGVLVDLGKPQEALALYQQALLTKQQLGDVREVAVTQHAMANVLVDLGKPQEAMALYQQALLTKQQLGDVRAVAVTQSRMADILVQQGKPKEALTLYEQALNAFRELEAVRDIATTQHAMANVLRQQGGVQEAFALYEQTLHTYQHLGDVRSVSVTQHAMADVLVDLGKPQQAMALYQQALLTKQQLGDVREVAMTQNAMANVLVDQGQPQQAMALYEQALLTKQQVGDVRGVAVTQYAMADVLRQLGKPQEALALYQQALLTYKELGDVRSVSVTQHAMADVLVDLGKPQEALTLYQQSLLTKQQLGDAREVAVTQANFSQLLLQQGEYERALSMVWDAYTSLSDHGYTRDTQIMQQRLTSIKGRILGPERFDALWKQVVNVTQPDWLRDVQASASTESGPIPSETLDVIVSNTITVMTEMPEKHDEWRERMTAALKQAQDTRRTQDAEFFAAVMAILDGQASVLPDGHAYSAALDTIQAGIAAGGPEGEDSSNDVSEEMLQAVRDFVNAKDWDATRQVVEARQAMLFRPVVEALFEQNIARAKADGEERAVSMLEQHLTILRACKAIGIAETFEQLASLADDSQEDAFPFDPELIQRSITALLGGPREKMAHAQYLMALANETADEALKSLVQILQLALFSNDLSQLGGDLKDEYRQAWEAIVEGVKANSERLEIIANNTVAVLGPAADKRSGWRDNLAALRNQATAKGDRNMLALLNAVIGLLDAGGDASGLGDGLTGVYEKTWLAIVEKLQR